MGCDYSIPDGGVDGGPFQTVHGFWTDYSGMEFEVIGLEFELFDEILFEIEEETIAG